MCGAADEVLAVLKTDRVKDKDKKKEIDTLLGTVTEERFALLVNLGKKITDYVAEEKTKKHGEFTTDLLNGCLMVSITVSLVSEADIDETIGVNVQFEESDDEVFNFAMLVCI